MYQLVINTSYPVTLILVQKYCFLHAIGKILSLNGYYLHITQILYCAQSYFCLNFFSVPLINTEQN